ncbi:MAG TPA: chromate resistance protein ChrB domain-containing protein [Edaphobacter sp.]|nr:chromate resistance protein ChrB domain-containing protein [Edaphobacter sp.]
MSKVTNTNPAPWLLLIFTLPSKKASERVGIWRKLQRYGTLALRNSGYVLPNTPVNQERFEWLATAIRGFKGEASVLQVQAIDDLPSELLQEKFREERNPDYSALIREIQQLKSSTQGFPVQLARLKRRFGEIAEIDFFGCPLRTKAEEAIYKAEHPTTTPGRVKKGMVSKLDYQNRIWITRPRPGIDRVSSAWLIKRFIDSKPTFLFDNDPARHPKAVPFDMYQSNGFGHEGENCTFETLCIHFGITDKKTRLIGQAIHDADLDEEKFGRTEGITINQILKGWTKQGIPDDELLHRGMDLIEGLYHSIA